MRLLLFLLLLFSWCRLPLPLLSSFVVVSVAADVMIIAFCPCFAPPLFHAILRTFTFFSLQKTAAVVYIIHHSGHTFLRFCKNCRRFYLFTLDESVCTLPVVNSWGEGINNHLRLRALNLPCASEDTFLVGFSDRIRSTLTSSSTWTLLVLRSERISGQASQNTKRFKIWRTFQLLVEE